MSNVTFKRSPNVNSIPIVDGQLIFDETNNKIYMDNGEQRLQYGGDVSLISSVDYATANNAFSALATTELFLNKNTVVDNKTDALAATEQGLPVGCLAFQSAIGQADYSSIDNTISACLLTINNKFTSQLKANNNDIYMDYHDGKYGVNTSSARGADTFIPFKQSIHFNLGSIYQVPSGTNLTTILTELGIDPDSLTSANFIYQCTGTGVGVYQSEGAAVYGYPIQGLSMNYNSTTHVLTYSTSTSDGTSYYNVTGQSSGYIHVFIDD